MKALLCVLSLLVFAHPARAAITSLTSLTASIHFDGKESATLLKALRDAGAAPRADGYYSIASLVVSGHRGIDPDDSCYKKVSAGATITYGEGSDRNGKVLEVNPHGDCTGPEGGKVSALLSAIDALGIDEDGAMGGRFYAEVKDLGCYQNKNGYTCLATIDKSVNLLHCR